MSKIELVSSSILALAAQIEVNRHGGVDWRYSVIWGITGDRH